MGEGGSGSVSGGISGGEQTNRNLIEFLGDKWGLGGMNNPLMATMISSLNDYRNAGALSDMLLGGRGFGQSRRYRQYNPVDPNYGYQRQVIPGYNAPKPGAGGPGGQGGPGDGPPGKPPVDFVANAASGSEMPMSRATAPGMESGATGGGAAPTSAGQPPDNTPPREGGAHPVGTVGHGTPGAMGPGQWDHGGIEGDKEFWDSLMPQAGPQSNEYWSINDDAPVPGQGLLGDIENYGAWNDIDQRLYDDLGWQAGGDLMDLEGRELGMWERFGGQNQLEKALEGDIGWQRSGELSDLEQQEKWGWKDVAGPGQYDELRGKTLTGMVEKPGLSEAEKGAMLASQTLPIRQALEEQNRAGDARAAASGNAAGRWGASNAASLAAAGQAGQAGRNVQMAAADYMRKDRGEGLQGLGGLQGQIDARKVQGTQGLSSLANRQRQNQQFGIQAGMGLNEQQRGAQAQAAQGVGGLGQRQRQNTQWGLGALADLNKAKSDQSLARIGLTKDMYDTQRQQGNLGLDRLTQLASLARGGYNNTESQSANVGASV